MPRSRSPPHHRRSKSPKGRHGRSKSPKPHHGRSKSPKGHHGRSKSPKHHHHGHSHSPKPHHHKPHHEPDSSAADPGNYSDNEEEIAEVEQKVSTMKVSDAAPVQAEPAAAPAVQSKPSRVSAPVAAVAAPVMAAAEPEDEAEDESSSSAQGGGGGKSKPKFFMSKMYGGEGGTEFDHMNRRCITNITIRGGKWVDGISVTYANGDVLSNGGDGGEAHSMDLAEGEYVNMVRLKEGKLVLALSFFTNKGNKLGPVGSGKGAGIGIFAKEGEGVEVKAPEGYRLIGIRGREGTYLDAIGFRWGPVSN